MRVRAIQSYRSIPWDCAEQKDWNRCWKCVRYDDCGTGAHKKAEENFYTFVIPIAVGIEAAVLMAALRLAGVL